MAVIIDGYNLIAAVGILGRGVGPGSLERARLALLNFLAESLPSDEIGTTTVVFDAKNAPAGLPRTVNHRGLTVRFAARYPDADSLIEEMILEESAPRSLTVVSSDHRIQRAARRRKAAPADSDVWYDGVVRGRRQRQKAHKTKRAEAKPPVPLLAEDVDYWVRVFGGETLLDELAAERREADIPQEIEPADGKRKTGDVDTPKNAPQDDAREIGYNPFPADYAEDILEKGELESGTYNPFPPGYGEDVEEPDDLNDKNL